MNHDIRLLPLLFACASAACGTDGSAGSSALVTDSAGVRIVTNTRPDTDLAWEFEPAFTLGGANDGPEAFYTVNDHTVGSDVASNIFVLDASGHRVLVFDSAGEHLRTLGREGNGPGELAQPWGLSVRPDGTVLVDDFGKMALVGFGPDGVALPGEEAALPGSPRAWVGSALYSDIRMPIDGVDVERFLYVVDGDTTELARLQQGSERIIELKSCGMAFGGMPAVFAPDIVWDAGPAGAVARVGAAYSIDVYDGARLVGRYERNVLPDPATPELAERQIGEGMTMNTPAGQIRCETSEVVEQRGIAAEVPAIRNLRLSPDGIIWVSRGGPRPEATPTDILAPDGTYLGTLPAEVPYPIGFLADGRALFVETDDLDVARLAVYEVRKVPSGFEPE